MKVASRVSRGIYAILLSLGLGPAPGVPSSVAAEPIYVNTYGSDWGLWARGHCRLDLREDRVVLEIEAVALEPNRNYPQALQIGGFRLSASYLSTASGAALGGEGASGPRVDYAASLAPGQKHVVRGLVLEAPAGRPPGENEVRVLVLQIVMASGAAFAVEIARTEGS